MRILIVLFLTFNVSAQKMAKLEAADFDFLDRKLVKVDNLHGLINLEKKDDGFKHYNVKYLNEKEMRNLFKVDLFTDWGTQNFLNLNSGENVSKEEYLNKFCDDIKYVYAFEINNDTKTRLFLVELAYKEGGMRDVFLITRTENGSAYGVEIGTYSGSNHTYYNRVFVVLSPFHYHIYSTRINHTQSYTQFTNLTVDPNTGELHFEGPTKQDCGKSQQDLSR